MKDKSLAVVIATIRPEAFKTWIEAWKTELHNVMLYVVEDAPYKTDNAVKFACNVVGARHYAWQEIDADLGSKSWIIPRRTSAIKSYGFLKAYQDGHDYIWTLDDDCLPEDNRAPYAHTLKFFLGLSQADDSWYNTIEKHGLYPRGYPYGIRQDGQLVMIHHGLWSGVPDLDGVTALEHHKLRLDPATSIDRIPTGQMFPMCGMNLAFRREMTPAMYFLLQGRQRDTTYDEFAFAVDGAPATNPLPFDRFDDIWAGLFAKRIADHLGYAVTTGSPSVLHTKLSDPTQRVIKEAPGIAAHEILWPKIASPHVLHGGHTTVKSCYKALADRVDSASYDTGLPFPDYWRKLSDAMHIWTELFDA